MAQWLATEAYGNETKELEESERIGISTPDGEWFRAVIDLEEVAAYFDEGTAWGEPSTRVELRSGEGCSVRMGFDVFHALMQERRPGE